MALEFLTGMNPLLLISLVSFFLSLVVVLAYKFLTPQKEMKFIKEEMQRLQQEMKEHKSNAKKIAEIQKTLMTYSMKQFSHSLKPTLATFVLVIPIFAWLNSAVAFAPIHPNTDFNVTVLSDSKTNFTSVPGLTLVSQSNINGGEIYTLKGSEGTYTLWFSSGNDKQSADVIITDRQEYAKQSIQFKDSAIKQIIIGNKELKPFGSFSFFGWHPGWVGTYIIFSLIFSTLLRKLLKVY